jgi:PKD repeat protein
MKYLIKNKNLFKGIFTPVLLTIMTISFWSCDPTISSLEFDLPEANSIADKTPPSANFSASATDNYLVFNFANLSTSATTYAWDFGDGASATTLDASHTYVAEGTYTVTLTASDAHNVTSTFSTTVEVVEPPVPVVFPPDILEPGFDQGNNSRDPWRNGDLGGVIQITGSGGYYEGSNAAKLPADASRIGYQELPMTPNVNYKIKFKYRIKDTNSAVVGSLIVDMIKPTPAGNGFTFANAIAPSNVVANVTYPETAENNAALVDGQLTFNSGANTTLAILFYNIGDECYIDSFTIEVL